MISEYFYSIEYFDRFFSRWKKLSVTLNKDNSLEIVAPRARALLVASSAEVIPPDGGLFACGGYQKSQQGEMIAVPEIICYDKAKNQWNFLSLIPNLKKLSIFAVDNDVLVISEKKRSENQPETDDIIPVARYDLLNRKWLMINGENVDEKNEQI